MPVSLSSTLSQYGRDWSHQSKVYHYRLWLLSNTLPARSDVRPFRFGQSQSGWQPVTGDWNENGIVTIGVYKSGLWQLRNNSSTGSPDIGYITHLTSDGWVAVANYRGDLAVLQALSMPVNEIIPTPIVVTEEATPEMTVESRPEETAEATIEVSPDVLPEYTEEPTVIVENTPEPTATLTPSPTPAAATSTLTATPTAIASPTATPSPIDTLTATSTAVPVVEPVPKQTEEVP